MSLTVVQNPFPIQSSAQGNFRNYFTQDSSGEEKMEKNFRKYFKDLSVSVCNDEVISNDQQFFIKNIFDKRTHYINGYFFNSSTIMREGMMPFLDEKRGNPLTFLKKVEKLINLESKNSHVPHLMRMMELLTEELSSSDEEEEINSENEKFLERKSSENFVEITVPPTKNHKKLLRFSTILKVTVTALLIFGTAYGIKSASK